MSPTNFAPTGAAISLLAPRPCPRITLACSRDLAEGAPRCEQDTGVLGTQVARRLQLNGPRRVANTALGLHPLQRDPGL